MICEICGEEIDRTHEKYFLWNSIATHLSCLDKEPANELEKARIQEWKKQLDDKHLMTEPKD